MRFATTVTTAPTVEPITLAEAKDYAKIEVSTDDALINDIIIPAARVYAENFTRRAFNTQTITMKIDWCFPNVIELLPDLQSVTAGSFTYVNTDGDTTQVPTATYTVDTVSDPGRVYLAFNQTWPTVRMQRQAVSIVYVVGYGATGETAQAARAAVPAPIREAIMMMVNHAYENRNPHIVTIGGTIVNVPKTVDALLLPYVMLI